MFPQVIEPLPQRTEYFGIHLSACVAVIAVSTVQFPMTAVATRDRENVDRLLADASNIPSADMRKHCLFPIMCATLKSQVTGLAAR